MLDGFDIFVVFLLWIGVVHAEIAHSSKTFSDAEVQGNGFGVTNVEVAVGFWWETRLQASAVFASGEVIFHNLLDEVERFFFLIHEFLLVGEFRSGRHFGCVIKNSAWTHECREEEED